MHDEVIPDDLALPPHSIEAESSVLGGLLLDNRAWDQVADRLRSVDFYRFEHRTIFEAVASLLSAGKPADVVTVFEHLQSLGKAEEAGSISYLNSLAQYVPSAANIRRYTEIVREKARSRALQAVGSQLMQLGADQATPIDQRVDAAQAEVANLLVQGDQADEWVSAGAGLLEHTQVLEDREGGHTTAMPTGLDELDDFLDGGARPGDLIIIGARPSMGKTAIGMTVGLHMARSFSVALLSMEMPHHQVRDRMIAILGRISLSDVKRPGQDTFAWDRVIDATEQARELKFFVTDKGDLNIRQVRSKARNVKRLHGLNVLLVDYIGLMSGLDARQPRAYQLEEISRGLKTLAKELDIAVICLAQVNRKVEERADATPTLSDLRDSGAIEQDADIVMFVHRPIQAKPDLGPEFKHYAKLSIAKNRNGRCGVLNLHYEGAQTRFAAWSGGAPTSQQKLQTRSKQFTD